MAWEAQYMGVFAVDPKAQRVLRLAAFLHLRTEEYDQRVCTGWRYGTVVARTPYERELSVKNATRIHKIVKTICEYSKTDLMAVRRQSEFRSVEDALACLIPEDGTRLPDRLVYELQQVEEWIDATETTSGY